MSEKMVQKFHQKFHQRMPLNPEQQRELQRVCTYEEFPKDCCVLECGEVSHHIYFILEGTMIALHPINGKEVIPWFAFEGDFVNSFPSFVHRKPSLERIVAISNCRTLSISYKSLQYLYSRDAIWNALFRLVLEEYYLETQERLISFLSQSAAERYDALIQQYPEILTRLDLGHIAAFLGIAQETLSRIRSRRDRRLRLR